MRFRVYLGDISRTRRGKEMPQIEKRFVLQDYLLYLAWIVSLIATVGSLYFSEIRGFAPCELCWFQRIFMYPLSILLGIAAYYGDRGIKKYVLPLSIIGGIISLFHYLQQKIPGFAAIKPCTQGVPCNMEYINWLGFITIPFLALIGFSFITVFMLLIKRSK
jgi:disulfide bond formation protein DsbB